MYIWFCSPTFPCGCFFFFKNSELTVIFGPCKICLYTIICTTLIWCIGVWRAFSKTLSTTCDWFDNTYIRTNTLLAQMETVINSRPLGYAPDTDLNYLSPFQLLIGRPTTMAHFGENWAVHIWLHSNNDLSGQKYNLT